ncbi:polynucleotide adenylyltransferase [Moraxella macacae 0408225]|uniref:Polynucleotide adenylyltransferase n=1 Tax=Moraxella macacae 0408225 TaxID=1230338 RepID=L2F6C7_9GAMM|nr:polynucleotide adenylyltransferase [Moraxella macacae]ELA08470.1 polynucleotide adenylyltransferase [Moraxella macacae 0408225]
MTKPISVYLVGGAVRDSLLNRPVSEHDYVVVGATPAYMLNQGFSQVGADFPVFLHPITHDEYALARTERKTGNGYHGFCVHADPKVTLEDDLIRRDLTINAMAIEVNGLFDNQPKHGFAKSHIIDPYGGLTDLQNKQLRHVSYAFVEDPVRVLRLARFKTRYAPLGFVIADTTQALVKKIKQRGELNHLVAERVWTETLKALSEPWADVYFDTLNNMGVLNVIMPNIALAMNTKPAQYWQMIGKSLQLAHMFDNLHIKFGLLALMFVEYDSKHSNIDSFNQFCQCLKTPKTYQQFGQFLLQNFATLMDFNQLNAKKLLALIKQNHGLKNPTTLKLALITMQCFNLAKQQVLLDKSLQLLNSIGIHDIDPALQGKAVGLAIDNLRLTKLDEFLDKFITSQR